jgi:DNA-binding CsgD family transcriptional regulator
MLKNKIFSFSFLFIIFILVFSSSKLIALERKLTQFDFADFFEERTGTILFDFNAAKNTFIPELKNQKMRIYAKHLAEKIFTPHHIKNIKKIVNWLEKNIIKVNKKALTVSYVFKFKNSAVFIRLFTEGFSQNNIYISARELLPSNGSYKSLISVHEIDVETKVSNRLLVTNNFNFEIVLKGNEFDILRFMLQGFTSQEIAGFLNLSPHTVNAQKKEIYKQFNATNAYQLIKHAKKKKII